MAMAIGRFGFHRVLCTLSSFLPPQDFCECVLIWKVDILGQLLGGGGGFCIGLAKTHRTSDGVTDMI